MLVEWEAVYVTSNLGLVDVKDFNPTVQNSPISYCYFDFRGVLATSEPPRVTNEEITIKTELVIENEFGFGNNNQKLTSPQSTPNEGTQPLQQTPQNQNSVIPVVINTQTTSMRYVQSKT